MTISHREYIYENLRSRLRRDDEGGLLHRFLTSPGEELDRIEATYNTLADTLKPETTAEPFIEWWLFSLFGWSWFPAWWTLDRKRLFYSHVANHYARRGTPRGIIEFLRDFGVSSQVFRGPEYWGEFYWQGDTWTINGPLGEVVQILPVAASQPGEYAFWGDFFWGLSYWSVPSEVISISKPDLERLLKFQQAFSQIIMLDETIYDISNFTPVQIDGCRIWLAADRFINIVAGASVPSWPNLADAANNFMQSTAGYRPTWQPAVINSKPVVRFDGVNDYLEAGSIVMERTDCFIVANVRSYPNDSVGIMVASDREYEDDAPGTTSMIVWSLGSMDDLSRASWRGESSGLDDFTMSFLDEFFIYNFTAEGEEEAVQVTIRKNTQTVVAATLAGQPTNWPQRFILGGRLYPDPTSFCEVDIAEIILFNRNLNPTERRQIENYLSAKYGLSI